MARRFDPKINPGVVLPEHRPLALIVHALEEAAAGRPAASLHALRLAFAVPSNDHRTYQAWPVITQLKAHLHDALGVTPYEQTRPLARPVDGAAVKAILARYF